MCVIGVSPSGRVTARVKPDGRYLLAGVRPGRYALRISDCYGQPVRYAWPGPAIARRRAARPGHDAGAREGVAGRLAGTEWRPAAGAGRRGKTGSIFGRVTARGRPLRDICAIASPSSHSRGLARRATTSKAGRYRITGLRPGRYMVLFSTGKRSCPARANWLPQYYRNAGSSWLATQVRVRAGKDTPAPASFRP